jgi:hypothetical protein
MKIIFEENRNAWYVEGEDTYFHMPFLKNCSSAFLKRVFRQDFGVQIDENTINTLRNPGTKNQMILNSKTKK